jgi:hypothetical protein
MPTALPLRIRSRAVVIVAPRRAVQGALLARRRDDRCLLGCQHRSHRHGAIAESVRRNWPVWTYQQQLATGQVRAQPSRPARHRHRVHGFQRLYRLRRSQSFAAVLQLPRPFLRAGQSVGLLPDTTIGTRAASVTASSTAAAASRRAWSSAKIRRGCASLPSHRERHDADYAQDARAAHLTPAAGGGSQPCASCTLPRRSIRWSRPVAWPTSWPPAGGARRAGSTFASCCPGCRPSSTASSTSSGSSASARPSARRSSRCALAACRTAAAGLRHRCALPLTGGTATPISGPDGRDWRDNHRRLCPAGLDRRASGCRRT